jgi:hypothetical protein
MQNTNSELLMLHQKLEQKQESLLTIQTANEQYKEKCFHLEQDIQAKIELINSLKQKNEHQELKIDQIYLEMGSDTALKVELQQLRQDNKRIMGLLKQTKEYQAFANYVEDSGGDVKHIDAGDKGQHDV